MQPQRQNMFAQNHAKFVTKDVRKAIMVRSRLWDIFLKEKFLESKKAYNKQRKICVSMVNKAKKEHFQNINLSEITDNKKFWETVSPLFGNKVKPIIIFHHKINPAEKM